MEKTNYNIGSISKKKEWEPNYKNITRGQEIINQFRPSGCLFFYSINNFENYNKFVKRRTYGFVDKNNIETVNIDTEEDFIKLDFLLKNNYKLKL